MIFILFIYLLYFARTSYNKLQRLMDNKKKMKKNWPGDHDSKNQLPWALEKGMVETERKGNFATLNNFVKLI